MVCNPLWLLFVLVLEFYQSNLFNPAFPKLTSPQCFSFRTHISFGHPAERGFCGVCWDKHCSHAMRVVWSFSEEFKEGWTTCGWGDREVFGVF